MGYLIINTKDNSDYREEMRNHMTESFRRSTHMRNMGGSPGAQYKSEEETKKAYCEGYEHGFEDAMKEVSQSGGEYRTSEFKYGR